MLLAQRVICIVSENKEQHINKFKFCLINCGQPEEVPDYTITMKLDETHLDAVRGLILPRGFHPAHQQVELVGAMRLCSTMTNRSAYAYAKDLIQS